MEHYVDTHIFDKYLRTDRLPHVWCPGCGIGVVLSCWFRAIDFLKMDPDKVCVVSGIGCTGRAPGYLNLDTFHTLHGRAIPFAVGLKLARPDLNVTVFSGDGDLFAIGGNHFIHAARRNNDLLVLCVNNFNYGMTGGQVAPTTPLDAYTTTSPYGNLEKPFNLPFFAVSCGATYVARWTVIHVRRLTESIEEALQRKGFRFIEVLAPCPTTYGKYNRMPQAIDTMRQFIERCEIRHFSNPKDADIGMSNKIIVGRFLDEQRESYEELVDKMTKRMSQRG